MVLNSQPNKCLGKSTAVWFLSACGSWTSFFSIPSQTSQLQHLNLLINHISHGFPSLGCVFSNSRLWFSILRRARKAAALVFPRKSLLCLFVKLDVNRITHSELWGHQSQVLHNCSFADLQRHHKYNHLVSFSHKAIEPAGVRANFKEIIWMNSYSCSAKTLLQSTSALLGGLISIYLYLYA